MFACLKSSSYISTPIFTLSTVSDPQSYKYSSTAKDDVIIFCQLPPSPPQFTQSNTLRRGKNREVVFEIYFQTLWWLGLIFHSVNTRLFSVFLVTSFSSEFFINLKTFAAGFLIISRLYIISINFQYQITFVHLCFQ